MFLIDDLLMMPVTGFKFILSQIQTIADRELNDESVLKTQLLELQMRFELDEIPEDDFKAQEADLFARLRVIRQRQMELLGEVHTAKSSSFVIDTGDESDEGGT